MSITSIEGNIGVGKSTFCKSLQKADPEAMVCYEMVTENPYLKRFYEDQKRWAFPMQMWILKQRIAQHKEAVAYVRRTGKNAYLDRSFFGDYVFCIANHQLGNIDDEQFAEYKETLEAELDLTDPPNEIWHLRAPPEVCMQRIKKRARGAEVGIELPYLALIRDGHLEVLAEVDTQYGGPVVGRDSRPFPTQDPLELFGKQPSQ
jgi:deoxyadenosine/deoxycytidine kinase